MVVQKGAKPQPELFGKILFFKRVEQGHGGSEGSHKGGALGAAREMLVKLRANVGREAAVEVIGQQGDDAGTLGSGHFNLKL